MTRLEVVKMLKGMAKTKTTSKPKDAEALNAALEIIREMNTADQGPERFCPRCEKRLAEEGVCMRCDSDMAEATPGHRTT